jgi:hypothetical protein
MDIVDFKTEPCGEHTDVDAKAQPDVVTPAAGDTLDNPLDLTMMDDEDDDEAFVNHEREIARLGPLVFQG